MIQGLHIEGTPQIAWLTDPQDPSRRDRGHVLQVGDGADLYVVKLIPSAFARHADQERLALRALERVRPAGLALPRLVPLPAFVTLDPAHWSGTALRYIPGTPIVGMPPDVSVGIFCSIVHDLAASADSAAAGTAELVFSQRMTQWLDRSGVPVLTLESHMREVQLLCEKCPDHTGSWMGFFRDAASGLDWMEGQQPVFVHNDLNASNVLKTVGGFAVIDMGCAIRSSPFVDLGGIVAHLGVEWLDAVAAFAKDRFADEDQHSIGLACRFFAAKRALRRLCYLSLLDESSPQLSAAKSRTQRLLQILTNGADA